jgi:two-component system nitrate/nitrite response regulator NarL
MTGIIKVVVVEPNPIYREGLVRILSEGGGMSCDGFAALEEIGVSAEANWEGAVFLIDLGQDCGVVTRGIAYLRKRFSESIVVVLSERYSHGHMLNALRAGACGYLMDHISCEALIKSVELISLGEHMFPAQAVELLYREGSLEAPEKQAITPSPQALSSREVEVLRCLGQGKANKVIARERGISEATVKVHVKAILRKIQVKNRTEAALWARDHGLGAITLPSTLNGS